jgi:hypothetical protein
MTLELFPNLGFIGLAEKDPRKSQKRADRTAGGSTSAQALAKPVIPSLHCAPRAGVTCLSHRAELVHGKEG